MKQAYEKPVLEEIRIETEDILLLSGELDEGGELFGSDKNWNLNL